MVLARWARTAALAALAAAASAVAAGRASAQELGLPVGTPAPSAAVETLAGAPADLARLVAGRPALVEFWATWCPNCKALEPQMAALARTYGARLQLVTVAVSVNQTPERVRRYVAARRLPGTVVFDRRGAATAAYDAPATSYVVVLDRTGRVVYTGQGGDQDLTAAVRRAFGPAPRPAAAGPAARPPER
jgi:thiol-disulfide isomerase/thioredoxin